MNLPAFPAPTQNSDAEFYLDELDQANKRLDRSIEQLEIVEALTTDPATAKRIRTFLQQEGVWPTSQQKS